MAEATGTIEPTPPSTSPLMDRIYNYINQPLNTEDPIQNLVSGVADFIPGISTELAKRRGDKLGEALSYLDVIGMGGAKLALTPFMIARRKELQQTLKNFDKDPILKGNESVRTSLQKELDQINKTEAEELRIGKQYDEFVKDPTKFGKSQPTKEVADATSKIGRNSITKNIKSSSLIDEGASEAKEEIVKQIGPDLFNFGLGSLKANKQGRKLDISDFQKLLTPPQMRMMDDMADSQNLFRVPASERLFNKKYNTLEPSMTGVDEYEAMIEALRNM